MTDVFAAVADPTRRLLLEPLPAAVSRSGWRRWSHEPEIPLDEGPSTLVEWRLSARPGGGTLLELRETGFETHQHWQENTQGWKSELGELVAHLNAPV